MPSNLKYFFQRFKIMFHFLWKLIVCFQLCVYPSLSASENNKPPSLGRLAPSYERAEKFNQDVTSLREKIFGENSESIPHPLDLFRLLDQSLVGQKAGSIPLENLLFEIVESNHQQVQGFLSYGQRNIPPALFHKNIRNQYQKDHSFVVKTESSAHPLKHNMRIVHQDKVLHSFNQDISWVATLGPYVVFLDPDLVSKDKIILSFVDLSYFESAVGKAKLPVFNIPLFIKNDKERQSILNPQKLQQEGEALNIDGFKITQNQMWFISRLQQLNFNLSVSLVDSTGQKLNGELIKDIIRTYTETLEQSKAFAEIKQSPTMMDTYQNMRSIIKKTLRLRSKVGSHQESSGSFVQLKHDEHRLSSSENAEVQKLAQEFTKNLKEDLNFQKEMNAISSALATQTKAKARLLAFLANITHPQPLGAPKIEKALGLIANTILPGETIDDRVKDLKKLIFKTLISRSSHGKKIDTPQEQPQIAQEAVQKISEIENTELHLNDRKALAQEGAREILSYKTVKGSLAALTGAALIAQPSVSEFFYDGLMSSKNWFNTWGELFSVTSDSAFGFLDLDTLSKSLVDDGNSTRLIKGLAALATIAISSVGLFHVSVNAYEFSKHVRSKSFHKHNKNVKKALVRLIRQIDSTPQDIAPPPPLKTEFISFMNTQKKQFLEDLSNAEMRKVGLKMSIDLPNNNHIKALLRTPQSWNNLVKKFNSQEQITLEINTKNEDDLPIHLKLISENKKDVLTKDSIRIHLSYRHDKSASRVFTFDKESSEEGLESFVDLEKMKLKDMLITEDSVTELLSVHFSGQDLHIAGSLLDSSISPQDDKMLRQAFARIKQKREAKAKRLSKQAKEIKSTLQSSEESIEELLKFNDMSVKEIKNLRQAIAHLFFGYSSFAKTFRFLGLGWNYFFLSRNFIMRPTLGFSSILFSQQFDRVYRKQHRTTELNGGFDTRLRDVMDLGTSIIPSSKRFRAAREAVEEKVIEIERHFLRLSTEQSYFEVTVREAAKSTSNSHSLRVGTQKSKDKLKNKSVLMFELYQRALFGEAVADFLKEKLNLTAESEIELKKQLIEVFQRDPQAIHNLTLESEAESKKRLERISKEKNLLAASESMVYNLFDGFFKKFVTKYNKKIEKSINPNEPGIMLNRFKVGEEMLNDPEALARATRYMTTAFMIDKPIELAFWIMIFAGIDQGFMKVVQEEAFSESSFFHLSRFTIWYSFFIGFILSSLSGVWFKVQMDSRLAELGGFNTIPNKEDVEKPAAFLRWFAKQMKNPDNSLLKNYVFALQVIWANIGAALILVPILQLSSLGRFDIDMFIAGYLMVAFFPLTAFGLKVENAFENSVNYSLKDLIKEGVDLQKKHKHLLFDPRVQAFKMKESATLRAKYNLAMALLFENFVETFTQTFENIETSAGPRTFQRMFFFGHTPTEHFVKFTKVLEEQGFSSRVIDACKAIFTNNRSDLKLD